MKLDPVAQDYVAQIMEQSFGIKENAEVITEEVVEEDST